MNRNYIRNAARDLGLTMADISRMCGVSRPVVAMWMNGTRTPSESAIRQLLKIMPPEGGERDKATSYNTPEKSSGINPCCKIFANRDGSRMTMHQIRSSIRSMRSMSQSEFENLQRGWIYGAPA